MTLDFNPLLPKDTQIQASPQDQQNLNASQINTLSAINSLAFFSLLSEGSNELAATENMTSSEEVIQKNLKNSNITKASEISSNKQERHNLENVIYAFKSGEKTVLKRLNQIGDKFDEKTHRDFTEGCHFRGELRRGEDNTFRVRVPHGVDIPLEHRGRPIAVEVDGEHIQIMYEHMSEEESAQFHEFVDAFITETIEKSAEAKKQEKHEITTEKHTHGKRKEAPNLTRETKLPEKEDEKEAKPPSQSAKSKYLEEKEILILVQEAAKEARKRKERVQKEMEQAKDENAEKIRKDEKIFTQHQEVTTTSSRKTEEVFKENKLETISSDTPDTLRAHKFIHIPTNLLKSPRAHA